MKSLNDNLREEFAEILKRPEILVEITSNKLDLNIVNKAFEKLLENKAGVDESKGRAEFETLIINSIKTKKH